MRENQVDEKSIRTLGYGEVLSRLGRYASFSASARLAETLHPGTDNETVRRNLARTTEARRLLSVNNAYQLGGCVDFRPALLTARKGGTIEAKAFVDIAATLAAEIGRAHV